LISLGSEYLEYWCYIEVIFRSSKGISFFVEQFQFEFLGELIWMKIVDRLKVRKFFDFPLKSILISRRYLPFVKVDSMMMKDYPNILNDFKKKNWILLYRGSRNGFQSSKAHEKCDNQKNTLTRRKVSYSVVSPRLPGNQPMVSASQTVQERVFFSV
jgi:hypothetical protein